MPFTPVERQTIRRHLGYPLISAVETLRSGMLPSGPDDLTFAMESALDNIIPASEADVRMILRELFCIEEQEKAQRGDLAVMSVGSTQLAGADGMAAVYNEHRRWAQRLSDSLGVPFYRHSEFHREIGSFGGHVIEPG